MTHTLRPSFHFSTPIGWCNDPNGFSFFQNKVHLFFQHYPYDTKWGPMHWGHAISQDFLAWEILPIAMKPEVPGVDEKGCFSGTALEDDNRHVIAYTGVTFENGKDIQNQCIAVGDGVSYTKFDGNPILTSRDIPFEYNREHFRDPKIWKKDGTFYMACVIKQKNDRGALVLFSSEDLKQWIYKGMLDCSKDGLSNMWECPDLFTLDGKDVFVLSPQEMKEDYERGFHNGNNSLYITGKLDYENFKFIREPRIENDYTAAQIDYGIDFYAPETTKLPDGRTIMIAWMQAWESYITPEDYGWSGMMTLPRELTLKNNRLYQKPVRELLQWRKNEQQGQVLSTTEKTICSKSKRCFELQFDVLEMQTGTVGLILGNEKEFVILKIDLETKALGFDRTNSLTPGAISSRKAKLEFENEKMHFQIIVDACSMEVFVDEGKIAFTNTFFFSSKLSDLVIKNTATENLNYSLWQLGEKTKF